MTLKVMRSAMMIWVIFALREEISSEGRLETPICTLKSIITNAVYRKA